MRKLLLNKYSEINLYKKMNSKSEVITQMIYGDSFFLKKTHTLQAKTLIFEVPGVQNRALQFIKNRFGQQVGPKTALRRS